MLPSLGGLTLDRGRKPVPTAAGERPRPEWAQQLTAPVDWEELQRLRRVHARCLEDFEVARRAANEANNQVRVLQRRIEGYITSHNTNREQLRSARAELAACEKRNAQANQDYVRVQNQLRELQVELVESRDTAKAQLDSMEESLVSMEQTITDQGDLIEETLHTEKRLVDEREEAQRKLTDCEEQLERAKATIRDLLRELAKSSSSSSSSSSDSEDVPELEEVPDPDPEPDPESTPDLPDPALDEAPCPDRDRPPGDNPQPPCDQRAPEPEPEPKGIVGTPILVLEANKEPVLQGPETEEWAGKTGRTMAELCKDTTAKEYLDCLLWICLAPHPLLAEEQLAQLAQLKYNPLTHKEVNARLGKIISANQLRRMKLYRVWPKDRVVSPAPAPVEEPPAAESPSLEVLSVEVVPDEEEGAASSSAEPSWANQNPWQKRMNQQAWMDNLTQDWAYPFESTPAQKTAYFKDALGKIEREVDNLGGKHLDRISEVPVLLRVAEEHLHYFVQDAFNPAAFWSTEVTTIARLAFFFDEFVPEWADAFVKFAVQCFVISEEVFEKRLPKLDKEKKKYTKADAKIYNSLQVIYNKMFTLMKHVSIVAFVIPDMQNAMVGTKALMLSRALPIWHQICALQTQARRITRELAPDSPLRNDEMLENFDGAIINLGIEMLRFDTAVGGEEHQDTFNLFSEDLEKRAWIGNVRKMVRNMMPYEFDSGAYERRMKRE